MSTVGVRPTLRTPTPRVPPTPLPRPQVFWVFDSTRERGLHYSTLNRKVVETNTLPGSLLLTTLK